MQNSQRSILASASLGALLSFAAGLRSNPDWQLQRDFINPDSAMRMVRLDAILQAHAPLYAVTRDGSGAGTVLHWSHLLDSLIVALAAPASLFVGWHAALDDVALLVGPLSMAALALRSAGR